MDHTSLRQFVAVAETLHFAHAARDLGLTRASVVATVRSLEAELGHDLFDRSATTTVLTAEGEALLASAREQLGKSARAAAASAAAPGGKAKASKGKGRAPAVKGERPKGKKRQSR